MVAGIFPCAWLATWLSTFEVWVAISIPYRSSSIQIFKQGLPDAKGGLLAILAHPHQCGPVPRPNKDKKDKPGQPKLPFIRYKPIEIRKLIVKAVAHALDAIKGDSAHRREPRNPRSLHIH
jgi:hypothetical protein